MPTVFALLSDLKPHWLDSAGDPASGFQLFVYTAGSSTKVTTYKDSDGAVANTNPIILDSRGEPPSGIYVPTGTYKLVLASDTDTDPPASAIWTRDNITATNDVAAGSLSEWVASGLTPTQTSATTFTLVGDQTTEFHVGRRLKSTNSGGTIYSTISASSYSDPNTTVTVVNDSGSLDSGLSDVSYGLLSADNPSVHEDAIAATLARVKVRQVVRDSDAAATVITGTIPTDDTIPQNTEGDEILSVSITPQDTANRLRIRAIVQMATGGTAANIALFQDSTADALAAATNQNIGTNLCGPVVLDHEMAAGTTSSTTFAIRAGANSGNSILNGASGSRVFGGVMKCTLEVMELDT